MLDLDELIAYYVQNGIPFTTPIGTYDASYMQLGYVAAENVSLGDTYLYWKNGAEYSERGQIVIIN